MKNNFYKKNQKNWLSKNEISKLINLDTKYKHILLMKTMYSGAFRVSEVLKIRNNHLLEQEKRFYILLEDQKTDKKNWEIQPVDFSLYRELERFIKFKNINYEGLIFKANKGTAYHRSYVYLLFNSLAQKANIKKKIGTHTFRRSRAVHLLDDTQNLYFVSKFLRHKSISTTLRYLKISKASMFDQLSKISSPISS